MDCRRYIKAKKNATEDYSVADTNPFDVSKQVSAVLPKGEELRTYQGKAIRKRADGRWWARYYENGLQKSVYGRTQDECYNKLRLALKQQKKNSTNKTPKSLTLGEWLKVWLELYKVPKLEETSLDKIHYAIRNMKPIIDIRLKKITSIDIQNLLNSIDGHRKREVIFTHLKDALTKAVKNKLISDNPFDAVEIKKEKSAEKRPLYIEEEEPFIRACKECKEGILFLLCLYQGLRIGEALAITYEDIDFAKRTITINKSLTEKNKLKATKNGEERTIPLFNRTIDILDNTATGRICFYSRPVYQRKIKNICDALNLNGITTHSLRHTFATRCAEAGISPKIAQQWLGHKTLEMTLNVYTHVNKDFEKKETGKFDTYFDT